MEIISSADIGMMIRKPIHDVFNAFVDPEITSQFWFTDSTGRLEEGKNLTWTWGMYHVSAPVFVEKLEANKTILISWGEGEQASKVLWKFTPFQNSTYVSISNYDFNSIGDALNRQIADSVSGFTIVLAGLKALLEHNIRLNLVGDKWPKEMQ